MESTRREAQNVDCWRRKSIIAICKKPHPASKSLISATLSTQQSSVGTSTGPSWLNPLRRVVKKPPLPVSAKKTRGRGYGEDVIRKHSPAFSLMGQVTVWYPSKTGNITETVLYTDIVDQLVKWRNFRLFRNRISWKAPNVSTCQTQVLSRSTHPTQLQISKNYKIHISVGITLNIL